MVSIAVKSQTQKRLKFAINDYCADKKLDDGVKSKLSYDYIINQLLDYGGVKQ